MVPDVVPRSMASLGLLQTMGRLQATALGVQEYKMEKAKVWFIRMALNLNCNVMACGNTMGQVFLWDMRSLTDKPQAVLSRECVDRSHSKSTPNITVCRLCLVLNCRYVAASSATCCVKGKLSPSSIVW